MTRVGDHGCWTIWGPQATVDHPSRIRKLTRVRRSIGERRYREMRYQMQCQAAKLKVCRLFREMARVRAELDKLEAAS